MTQLVIGTNPEVITAEAQRIITVQYRFTSQEDPDVHVLNGYDIGTLGIELVRNFCKELQKKPFRAAKQIGIIIGFEHCTIEAQNALLKELEDHANSTDYILCCGDETAVLATIKSRSQIRFISSTIEKKSSKVIQELAQDFLNNGDVVSLFAKISNKEWNRLEAESLLSTLFLQLTPTQKTKQRLLLLQKASEYLSHNIAPKQVLTHLMFGLRKVTR